MEDKSNNSTISAQLGTTSAMQISHPVESDEGGKSSEATDYVCTSRTRDGQASLR